MKGVRALSQEFYLGPDSTVSPMQEMAEKIVDAMQSVEIAVFSVRRVFFLVPQLVEDVADTSEENVVQIDDVPMLEV